MSQRNLTILIAFAIQVLSLRVAAQTALDRVFKGADEVYQKDPAAGLKKFQDLYQQAIQLHDKTIEVRCTNLFTEYYWTKHDYLAAMDWGQLSIHKAELYGKDTLAGDAGVLMGLVYYSTGKYPDAIAHYQKAVAHYQKLPVSQRLGLAYMNLGVAERKLSRFETANTYYFKASDIFQRLGDQSYLASVYTAIGNSYTMLENFRTAIRYQRRSLALFRALKNPLAEAQTLNNLGFAFKQLRQPDSAINCLLQAIHLYSLQSDSSSLVNPLQNLGSSWKQKGNIGKAIRYILRSLQIADLYRMEEEGARGKADLAECYIVLGRFPDAVKLLTTANATAEKLKLADLVADLAGTSSQLQYKLGNKGLALAYYKKRYLIIDSLRTDKKLRTIEDLQIKYETREKERDIDDLHVRDRISQKTLGEQRFSIMVLIISAILLLALLSLAFYSFRAQRKANVMVKELMKEVNHRTKNNLQILSSLLMLQIENQEDESVKRALQETEVRLHTMNIMYSKLYTGQASTTVDMAEYLSSLLEHIEDGFSHERKRVELVRDLEHMSLPTDKAVLIGLVLNELSSNAIKHANSASGVVLTVSLKRKDSRRAQLSLKDNGKPNKKNQKSSGVSFGLSIVSLIIDQLDGNLETEPGNPYAYVITFER